MIVQFRLTPEERESKLWKRISEHLAFRIETLRTQNEGDKDAIETAKLRGRIAELKSIIALDKDPIDLEISPPR